MMAIFWAIMVEVVLVTARSMMAAFRESMTVVIPVCPMEAILRVIIRAIAV
jgi:hypothetical protein